MPKQKNFFKKSLSIGVVSSALFVAGCGTADIATEQPAESEATEQTGVETTTASGDSGESEEEEESGVEEETGTDETETSSAEEENKGVPEDQAGITTDFPLGTPLADLLEYYGTPTYDEFFLGSRLVVFDEIDGYFLDSDDKASGFLIANPDVDIFGARIGMTFEEIDAVLEKEGEVFFDQSETQDYVSLYYVENYRITFYADTADGASQYAIVVRDK
ncbi:hypothetical protein [Planococcus dechangensis]|uniref:DUF4309 domain-containing protein n=1 Tax=Planococcus dechangensis TaxID=1176255 RepID=A0ABV9MF91_9BACL